MKEWKGGDSNRENKYKIFRSASPICSTETMASNHEFDSFQVETFRLMFCHLIGSMQKDTLKKYEVILEVFLGFAFILLVK